MRGRFIANASALSVFVIVAALLGVQEATEASTIYFNDFQGVVGAEWSNTATAITPVGARRFLGQFGAETVSLSLGGIAPHSQVTIDLDLFIILTWDGTGEVLGAGPDVWRLSVTSGPTLLNTTFALHPNQVQNYPDAAGSLMTHPLATGAAEHNTLGYIFSTLGDPEDAVYHLSFTFAHADSTVAFDFAGIGLQAVTDESWGLDNVRVSIDDLPVSEPATTFLFASGALFAAVRRWRRV